MRFISLFFLFPSLCFAGDWSKEDTYRQSTLTALLVADWAQTRASQHDPRFQENNAILSSHASNGRINNYFGMAIISHAVISYALPSDWRQGWQYVWIGIELKTVQHNHSIGVKFNF